MKKSILLAIIFIIFSQVNIQANKEISKKTELINKLVELTYSETKIKNITQENLEISRVNFNKVLQSFLAQMPQEPEAHVKIITTRIDRIFNDFTQKVEHDLSVKDVQGLVFKFYNDEFSESEIQELLNFYETPIGKKLNSKNRLLEKNVSSFYQSVTANHVLTLQNDMLNAFSIEEHTSISY